jgi:hypothetical protein
LRVASSSLEGRETGAWCSQGQEWARFLSFPGWTGGRGQASQQALGLRNTRTLGFQEPSGPFPQGLLPSHNSGLSLSLRLGSLVCQSQGVVADTSAEGSPLLLSPQRYPSKLSTPEYTVELKGASLSWAPKEKSSKKNVLEVSGEGGQERGAY